MSITSNILKTCPKCTKSLPPEAFANKLSARDGKASWCKKCTVVKTLQSRKNNPLRHRFNNSKSVAKIRKLEWNISFNDFKNLAEMLCHYCESPIDDIVAGSGLDRIDNESGYVFGNVLPCCCDCNQMRGDRYTVEETKVMITALLNLRKSRV